MGLDEAWFYLSGCNKKIAFAINQWTEKQTKWVFECREMILKRVAIAAGFCKERELQL